MQVILDLTGGEIEALQIAAEQWLDSCADAMVPSHHDADDHKAFEAAKSLLDKVTQATPVIR